MSLTPLESQHQVYSILQRQICLLQSAIKLINQINIFSLLWLQLVFLIIYQRDIFKLHLAAELFFLQNWIVKLIVKFG